MWRPFLELNYTIPTSELVLISTKYSYNRLGISTSIQHNLSTLNQCSGLGVARSVEQERNYVSLEEAWVFLRLDYRLVLQDVDPLKPQSDPSHVPNLLELFATHLPLLLADQSPEVGFQEVRVRNLYGISYSSEVQNLSHSPNEHPQVSVLTGGLLVVLMVFQQLIND